MRVTLLILDVERTRQQLQELLAHCSAFAKKLKRMQLGPQHDALAPNLIAFGLAR